MPGFRMDIQNMSVCRENSKQSHGLAYSILYQIDPENQVGLAFTEAVCYPAADSAEDIDAVCQMTFAQPGQFPSP